MSPLRPDSSSTPGIFTRISTQDTSYVHRYGPTSAKTRFDIESGMIQTGNHAFYIGKIFPEDWRDVISQARGKGKTHDENIYSKPFIKGILNFLSKCKSGGTVAKIVICRGLGELFNGTEDLQGAFSTEQAKEYIYDIAESFGFTKENLQVVSMEEEHSSIFAALQRKKNIDTGLVDGEKVYTEHTSGALDPNSADLALDIATLLQREIGTNFELKAKIEATVPDKENLQDEEKTERSYYGLTEIAIRLADLIRGRVFQGGHMRQKVYDEVIRYIYTRKGGSDSLNPIYDLIKDKDFGRLYIHEADNPFEKKSDRLISRVRAGFYTLMAAGLIGVSSYAGAKVHEHRQEQSKVKALKHISDKLVGTEQFRYMYIANPEGHIRNYYNQIQEAEEYLEKLFGLPTGVSKELALGFAEFLVNNNDKYPLSTSTDVYRRVGYLSVYLESKRLFFIREGIPFPKIFAHTPSGTYDQMFEAFKQKEFIHVEGGSGYSGAGLTASINRGENKHSIYPDKLHTVLDLPDYSGSIENPIQWKTSGKIDYFEDNGKRYYIFRKHGNSFPFVGDSLLIRTVASRYIRLSWAQSLAPFLKQFCDMQVYSCSLVPEVQSIPASQATKYNSVQHPSGKLSFDFIIREAEDKKFGKFHVVYARKSGETDFTYKTGKELEHLYAYVYYDRFQYDNFIFDIDY